MISTASISIFHVKIHVVPRVKVHACVKLYLGGTVVSYKYITLQPCTRNMNSIDNTYICSHRYVEVVIIINITDMCLLRLP